MCRSSRRLSWKSRTRSILSAYAARARFLSCRRPPPSPTPSTTRSASACTTCPCPRQKSAPPFSKKRSKETGSREQKPERLLPTVYVYYNVSSSEQEEIGCLLSYWNTKEPGKSWLLTL